MKPIVAQLPKDQIIAELTSDKLLRKTNNGNNEVYIFDNNNSPSLMHEVGRVREITFRHAGGGTGKEIDIDEFDTAKSDPQKQLIVWDPENQEIIDGYRFYFPEKWYIECDIYRLISIFLKNFLQNTILISWNLAGHLFTLIISHDLWAAKACLPLIIFGMVLV